MARTPNEVKQLVEEVESPFKAKPSDAGDLASSLRDRMKLLDNVIYTREDYAKRLSPLLANRINVGPALLRYWRNRLQADMRNALRVHLEPKGALKRHETAADRMEVYEAHCLLQLQGEGDIRENIHALQAAGFFWAGWLEMNPYVEAVQAKDEDDDAFVNRAERQKRSYFPYRIVERHPESVAFMENNRELTYAVCRFKLPVVDILERYGEVKRDDPEQMLKVYGESFSWLRADEPGRGNSALDAFRNEIEVILVADATSCSHYVDLGPKQGRRNHERWRALGEGDYPNPFGQVPLLLCEGTYNPHQPIAYRRESLLHSLINIEDAKAVLKSTWASMAASPPWPYEQMPKEMSHENPPPEIAFITDPQTGRPRVARSWGELKQYETVVDANQEKLYSVFEAEGQVAAPSGLLNAEAAELSAAPTTTVLTQLDEAKSLLGSAQRSETRMWDRVLDMIEHAQRNTLNSHRSKGEPQNENSDWLYEFTATSQERVYGRKVDRGEQYQISPQDMDLEYTRSLDPVDERLSTQAAQLSYWTSRRAAQAATYDEWLEGIGVENRDKFTKDMLAEQLFQLEVPRIIRAQVQKYGEAEAALQGRPVEQVLAEIAVEPLVAGVQGATGGNGGQSVVRMGAGVTSGVAPEGGTEAPA